MEQNCSKNDCRTNCLKRRKLLLAHFGVVHGAAEKRVSQYVYVLGSCEAHHVDYVYEIQNNVPQHVSMKHHVFFVFYNNHRIPDIPQFFQNAD